MESHVAGFLVLLFLTDTLPQIDVHCTEKWATSKFFCKSRKLFPFVVVIISIDLKHHIPTNFCHYFKLPFS